MVIQGGTSNEIRIVCGVQGMFNRQRVFKYANKSMSLQKHATYAIISVLFAFNSHKNAMSLAKTIFADLTNI